MNWLSSCLPQLIVRLAQQVVTAKRNLITRFSKNIAGKKPRRWEPCRKNIQVVVVIVTYDIFLSHIHIFTLQMKTLGSSNFPRKLSKQSTEDCGKITKDINTEFGHSEQVRIPNNMLTKKLYLATYPTSHENAGYTCVYRWHSNFIWNPCRKATMG